MTQEPTLNDNDSFGLPKLNKWNTFLKTGVTHCAFPVFTFCFTIVNPCFLPVSARLYSAPYDHPATGNLR